MRWDCTALIFSIRRGLERFLDDFVGSLSTNGRLA